MLRTLPFTKMHGLGNCYIYLDGVTHHLDIPSYSDLARRISNPYTGIGSDGLIMILPSKRAGIAMRIFNKDGSEAKNCGNGLRCVAKYAYEHHLVETEQFTIETLGGNVQASVHPQNGIVETVTIDMGAPVLARKKIPVAGGIEDHRVVREPLTLNGENYHFTAVSMGNPHALFFFVDDISKAPLHELGAELADTYPLFPEGVNVGFIQPVSDREIEYRVWERGSGMTQACGTGACASVVASILESRLKKDKTITVHLAGGDLSIEWQSATDHVLMTGSAVTICEGIYFG
ncbi:diaminopimelate epimerase [Terrilactibacillus sp. S3-3]|nr:diaminopimelate epimerase [Terrilactibacillus sp. S3-3]